MLLYWLAVVGYIQIYAHSFFTCHRLCPLSDRLPMPDKTKSHYRLVLLYVFMLIFILNKNLSVNLIILIKPGTMKVSLFVVTCLHFVFLLISLSSSERWLNDKQTVDMKSWINLQTMHFLSGPKINSSILDSDRNRNYNSFYLGFAYPIPSRRFIAPKVQRSTVVYFFYLH